VTITGANFTGASAVRFNGLGASSFTVDSPTRITVLVPYNATTGRISVTTSAGTGTSSDVFTVTPRITSFTPISGPPGTVVTVNGLNFAPVTDVKFNTTSAAAFTIVSASKITATVPSGATSGWIWVYVGFSGVPSGSVNFTVIYTPSISGFSPASGGVGQQVTLSGANFTGTTSVKFNSVSAGFKVNSDGSITATVPSTATTGKITVTNSAGTGSTAADFVVAPRITSLTPTSGIAGSTVVINGANFGPVISVTFANSVPASFRVDSAVKITATVPANAVTGKITVSAPLASASSASFQVKPQVSGFDPSHGAPGDSVTITGTALSGATAVKFNGTAAIFTVDSWSQITAKVPANATTGTISVTTAGGTATSVAVFTVAPRITSFTPTSGPPGTAVTVNGANFTGVTSVQFNLTEASFTFVSATKITATVPAGATTGKISVTTPAGAVTSATSFTVP